MKVTLVERANNYKDKVLEWKINKKIIILNVSSGSCQLKYLTQRFSDCQMIFTKNSSFHNVFSLKFNRYIYGERVSCERHILSYKI